MQRKENPACRDRSAYPPPLKTNWDITGIHHMRNVLENPFVHMKAMLKKLYFLSSKRITRCSDFENENECPTRADWRERSHLPICIPAKYIAGSICPTIWDAHNHFSSESLRKQGCSNDTHGISPKESNFLSITMRKSRRIRHSEGWLAWATLFADTHPCKVWCDRFVRPSGIHINIVA